MTVMRTAVLTVAMATAVWLTAEGVAARVAESDAAKVLADMRAAMGTAEALRAVRTVTAEGTLRRTAAKGATEGPFELALELPDKFVTRTALTHLGPMSTYLISGVNGDGLVYQVDAPPNLAGGAGKKAAVGKGGGKAGAAPEDAAAAMQSAVLSAKHDFARWSLPLLGASTATFPLEFRYVAEADSPDGSAHVIEARGAGAFQVQLFVDTGTHRPLMMRWPQLFPGAKGAPPKEVTYSTYYADFKSVSGVMLPHRVQKSAGAAPTEEITLDRFRINTTIDSKRFAVAK